MEMGVQEWRFAWDIAQFALTGAIGVYVWIAQRAQVRRESLQRLEDDLDGRLDLIQSRLVSIEAAAKFAPSPVVCSAMHSRIAVIEEGLRRGPSDEDIKRLHARVDDVAQGLAEVRGVLPGITRLLNNIDDHLRSPGRSA